MLSELQGRIERITYTNEENGYTIARLNVHGRQDLVTIVGTMIAPLAGEVVRLQGEWTNHPKHGEQFKIVSYNSMIPADVHGIEKYLGSGLIKGIGPVMAKRIVKKFGKITLDIIEHEAERLSEVEGIGAKRIEMIERSWAEQRDIREVMIFLQAHGVGSGFAAKIFKQYGKESIDIVRSNPYRLASDIFGIGFLTADRIAEKLGFAKDSGLRVEAGILYVLHQLADEGHVFYPYEQLVDKCREVLAVQRKSLILALESVALTKRIIMEELNLGGEPEENKAVYLAKFHVSETGIARYLKRLISVNKSLAGIEEEKAIAWVQNQLSIKLAERQVEAVAQALRNKVMVITGGPGTGKTTIIRSVVTVSHTMGAKVLLAAPTGRAAKRMSEATGYEAKTVHRMLEFSPKNGAFQKNSEFPLDCDLLIIDEASMLDTILMYHLLKAIPIEASLILVGDVNQLPSVGAGNVLNDIIGSGVVPVVKLSDIFRQAKESLIIVNAHRINAGSLPVQPASSDKLEDFYFIERENPTEAVRLIVELVKERIPKRFGLNAVDDIQVLTPMHKGMAGAGNLNIELQKALNPSPDHLLRGGRSFRLHDKIMQIKNNYDKEVFNGDIGKITGIDSEAQEVTLSFDGRKVIYDFTDLDEIAPAYAVSVHKSQGSEYPAVVMPVLTQHYVLLQRNLIYTGITRGKKLVVLVGTKRALAIAVKNNKTQRRFTHLKTRLRLPIGPESSGLSEGTMIL